MPAYYNEIDPYAAQWLRNLIAAGHIAPGDVDERSIEDVHPDDLKPYTQCHFFAGVGVWSYALRRAGWPDDGPVWTGSRPCQPFSAAGAGAGFDDQRHLWPHFHWLISECQPAIVFGEQVASKDAEPWLDLVQADVEALAYAFGAIAFPSAGVGAPHIRDRTYWVADANRRTGRQGRAHLRGRVAPSDAESRSGFSCSSMPIGMDHTNNPGLEGHSGHGCPAGRQGSERPVAEAGVSGRMGNAEGLRRKGEHLRSGPGLQACGASQASGSGQPCPVNGLWANADWLLCRDGKWRPVEASPQPLVDGSAESLGRLRPEVIAQVEEEIDASTAQAQGGRAAAMRTLLESLGEEAKRCWQAGGLPGLHEAPFLLAFMRQLQEQGWQIAEGIALPCSETESGNLRGVRGNQPPPGAPCERGLDRQSAGKSADIVCVLSRILARHASQAWDDAYASHAEIGFPLGSNSRSRIGRLRAYGNAINAEAATQFIAAYLDL
ncbi:DNA cytosine methyltransferase [Pseudomonas fulva]|uniref:DNA cytosine methyltransferase n=1 Tax=Pseudomonas fulva TaxID=47880 RepID=UPI00384D87C0